MKPPKFLEINGKIYPFRMDLSVIFQIEREDKTRSFSETLQTGRVTDLISVFYAMYVSGCKRTKDTPISFEAFADEISEDMNALTRIDEVLESDTETTSEKKTETQPVNA